LSFSWKFVTKVKANGLFIKYFLDYFHPLPIYLVFLCNRRGFPLLIIIILKRNNQESVYKRSSRNKERKEEN